MDARGGRATFGAARLENGNSCDGPKIETYGASHTQAKDHLEQTPACRAGAEGKGEIARCRYVGTFRRRFVGLRPLFFL